MHCSIEDVSHLVSVCDTVPPQRLKKIGGDSVRVQLELETFQWGYDLQLTEKLFTIGEYLKELHRTKFTVFQSMLNEPEPITFTLHRQLEHQIEILTGKKNQCKPSSPSFDDSMIYSDVEFDSEPIDGNIPREEVFMPHNPLTTPLKLTGE